MRRYVILFLQGAVIFFLGFHTPAMAMAAETDQTHLNNLVKTKRLMLIKQTRRHHKILPTEMARINAYDAALADILARAHQLRFLISVSESNPFEVRMYFKQADELRDEFERKSRRIRRMAWEIEINLSIVESARQDLRFIAQTAVSKEQTQDVRSLLGDIDEFEAGQLRIKKNLDAVMARSNKTEKELMQYTKGLEAEMAVVWAVYFTKPLFRLFDEGVPLELPLSYAVWTNSVGPTLESKLPDSPIEWGQSAFGFLATGLISVLIFRWILGRLGARSHGNQDAWAGIYRASGFSVFLCTSFWGASLMGVFPENIIFSKIAVIFGSLAAISFTWGLRERKLSSGLSSPLYPFFYLYAAGIIAQIANIPLQLLGVLWPLGVGIMMVFMWRTAGRYKNPEPRRLALFCFWSGFPIIGLSLAGFTFPAMEVFLTLFLCCIIFQFALAVSVLIRHRLTRLQKKGESLLHTVIISLGTPLIWFLSVGLIIFWIADQFGKSRILNLADSIELTWKDFHVGFLQIVVAMALFFVSKPVAQVLKSTVDGMGRKSQMDQTAIVSVKTVVGYGVWAVYSLVLLHILGVSLSSIVVLAGGMSVGIGFGMQHIINNFVSGLILLFGRSVRPGDVIEHELVMGVVEKVTIRNTLVRTRDDTTMLIPNSNLVSMPFVNMSRNDRAVRLIVSVGAAYDSDPELVQRLLMEAALEHPGVLKHPAPRVRFEDFQDNYLDFRVKFWVDFDGSKRIASDLRFTILKKFRDQGVEIAFPQMDLHLKEVPQASGILKAS